MSRLSTPKSQPSVDMSDMTCPVPTPTLPEATPTACCGQDKAACGEQAIRDRAYAKWEAAGSPPGDGVNFWLDAEVELAGTRD